MSGRKADIAVGRESPEEPMVETGDEGEERRAGSEEAAPGGSSLIQDQDRFLPIANVGRIMKREIPGGGKIAKDAKECVQECVSEFISFVSSEASERCAGEKRKTINGEDVLGALQSLGFDPYLAPLRLYLHKYREAQKGDKAAAGELPASPPPGQPSVLLDPSGLPADGPDGPADDPAQPTPVYYTADPNALQGGQFVAVQTPNGQLQLVQLVQPLHQGHSGH